MEAVVKVLPWALIFIFAFLFMYLLHRRFVENNVWGKVVKKYKDNVDAKVLSEAAFVTRFGSIENNSILYKLDRLMLLSGIKNRFKFINGEVFLGAIILASIAGFFEGTLIWSNGLVGIFLASAQAVVLYGIAMVLAGKTYNQIEDNTAIFISILSNHAKGSSDIVTIFQNTIPSLSGPLKKIAEKFVADAESTGNVDIAFDYMKESVDNRQLQTIFVNLKNCMHYQANYEEVLAQMMSQVAGRAGRRGGSRGHVILQTKQPRLPVVAQIVGGDYEGMFAGQIAERREFLFPPFCRLIVVCLKHRYESACEKAAEAMATLLRPSLGTAVLGPYRPAVGRVQYQHIRRLVVKVISPHTPQGVKALLLHARTQLMESPEGRGVAVFFDVDPI